MPSPIAARIIAEVVRGNLQNERGRLGDADRNFDFFHGRFEKYPTREENGYYRRADRRRTTRIMRRVIEVLTESQYKKPPVRRLRAGDEASAWLDRCYAASDMASVWPKADQFAHVADVAALHFVPNDDPATLVDVQLYGADQFVVWCSPDDPRRPVAVAILDKFDASARLRLWTAEEFATFVRPKDGPTQTSGGRVWALQSREPNELGTIPFAFVHAEAPVVGFWTEGPGDFLQQLNDNVNGQLDELGDSVRFGIYPIPVAVGVAPGFVPPSHLKPGQWIKLPAPIKTAGGPPQEKPDLVFRTPPVEYVAVGWDDMNRMIDRGLEDCGIPPGVIRMVGNAESGVAMLIETGPLVKRAEGRRQLFDGFENRAARKAAEVAAAWLRANGRDVPPYLDETAADPSPLSIKWAPLYVQLPGPERDRSDSWLLANQLTDKVEILMAREELTEEEAVEKLLRIARRGAQLLAAGIEPGAPPEPTAPGAVAGAPPEVTPQNAE